MWSIEQASDQWNKKFIDGFINFWLIISQISEISANQNVNLRLASQMKCDNMFSDPESDHISSHFSVTHLVYIFFLFVCGNYPLTSKRGRCRDLLEVDSWFNWINLITNIISWPVQSRDLKKFTILIGDVFQYNIE